MREKIMIQERDIIALTNPIQQHDLQPGDVGTVLLVHENGSAYEVEFTTLIGDTIAVLTISNEDIRKVSSREIAHVRELS